MQLRSTIISTFAMYIFSRVYVLLGESVRCTSINKNSTVFNQASRGTALRTSNIVMPCKGRNNGTSSWQTREDIAQYHGHAKGILRGLGSNKVCGRTVHIWQVDFIFQNLSLGTFFFVFDNKTADQNPNTLSTCLFVWIMQVLSYMPIQFYCQ